MDRLIVEWATTDPDGLTGRLTTLGFAMTGRDRLVFPAGEIRLIRVEPARAPDRLQAPRWEPAVPGSASRPGHANGVRDLAALGWATVDADRTSTAALDDPSFSFRSMPDDEHLGARVRGSLTQRPGTLVLEPATEGRLAATLARVGEGPVALYLVAGYRGLERLAAAVQAGVGGARAAAARAAAGRVWPAVDGAGPAADGIRPGPLGPSLLLPGGGAWGPHLLVVADVTAAPASAPAAPAPDAPTPDAPAPDAPAPAPDAPAPGDRTPGTISP
jgi:hypothetical protein